MALNIEKVNFLYQQLYNSEYSTLNTVIAQLFNYLKTEVKDNPVYDMYEKDVENWKEWPTFSDDYNNDWQLPTSLDESKSLAYSMYKQISENDYNWMIQKGFTLFAGGKLYENLAKLNKTFYGYFGQAIEDIIDANSEFENLKPSTNKNDTVFIVHGHDNELKQEVQILLNRAGVNSVVLHEQADRGRTIIDKLLDETKKAGYAIALLTPDDIVENESKRARQNVILEIGYFIGLLGKERLRLIVKQNVEIPSDLQGILYEKYDCSGAWKIKLLKELQAVGIYVDIQLVINSY